MSVCKIAELVAKSVDPDQMPHSAASDLGLQFAKVCLSMVIYQIKPPHRNHPGSLQSDQNLLLAYLIAKDRKLLHADDED